LLRFRSKRRQFRQNGLAPRRAPVQACAHPACGPPPQLKSAAMTKPSIYREVQSDVLSEDWGRLTRYTFDLRRRDGVWQRQTREVYDRGNAAVCLLYDPSHDCVLLTRQFRLPVLLNGGPESLIEAPAGLLEGADPAERMRAELLEETGYEARQLDFLFNAYMSPGSVTEFLACFLGTYDKDSPVGTGGGLIEEGEDIEVLHLPLTQAMEMIDTGEISDAKTIILLQKLWIQRGLSRFE